MKYFPINLDIKNRFTIVIGGGDVAERKCLSLLNAGARVKVVAPESVPGIIELASEGRIELEARNYREEDLDGACLVFAATDRKETNRRVAFDAGARGIPVNVADSPETGTFISPAAVCRGDLLLTVSTGGKSPALAARIREEIETRYGIEYEAAVGLLGAVREKLLTENRGDNNNKKLFRRLVSQDLPGLFRSNSLAEIDRLLEEIFGPEYSLQKLSFETRDPA